MPSVKPNWTEIVRLKKERGLSERTENIFFDIYQNCRSALEGGYITIERARALHLYLKKNKKMAAIFPNNLLCSLLEDCCERDELSSDDEKFFLDFIAKFYLIEQIEEQTKVGIEFTVSLDFESQSTNLSIQHGREETRPPDIQYSLEDFIRSNNTFTKDIRSMLFDRLPQDIEFKKRFVGFSGKFSGYTRKSCFQEIRRTGGVPCDPDYFLDYFFAAYNTYDQNVLSSKLSQAIYFRRLYGNPLIFTEEDWYQLNQRNTVPTK